MKFEDGYVASVPKRNQSRLNRRGKHLSSLGLALVLLISSQAAAETLDSAALEKLALQGTWASENRARGNWSWNKDKTVCLRIGDTEGNCADTGTWVINNNVICYELTWWGETMGNRKACFTTQALGGGRYELLHHGGAMVSTFFYFKVLE